MVAITEISQRIESIAYDLGQDHGTRSVRNACRALREVVADLQGLKLEPDITVTPVAQLPADTPENPTKTVEPMLRVPRIEGQG